MKPISLKAAAIAFGTASLLATLGCEGKKEKILDVDTPDGGIEVQRDKETGEIDVKVE